MNGLLGAIYGAALGAVQPAAATPAESAVELAAARGRIDAARELLQDISSDVSGLRHLPRGTHEGDYYGSRVGSAKTHVDAAWRSLGYALENL